MGVNVDINQAIYRSPDKQKKVEVNGAIVGDCLREAAKLLPGLEKALLDPDGGLFSHVDILINGKSAFPDELTKKVEEGDRIQVTRAKR